MSTSRVRTSEVHFSSERGTSRVPHFTGDEGEARPELLRRRANDGRVIAKSQGLALRRPRRPHSRQLTMLRSARCLLSTAPPTTRALSSARYAAASAALASLPELQAARDTPDFGAAHAHLTRALDIAANAGDARLVVVARGHLARLCHTAGRAAAEREHRVAALDVLRAEAAEAPGREHAALVASACNGLALACLRVGGAESALAAGAAAAEAERGAREGGDRDAQLAAALHAALARPDGSDARRMLLAAVARLGREAGTDEGGLPGGVDAVGWADFFLSTGAPVDGGGADDVRALERMRGVVDRWTPRGGFDLVEARCAAAGELLRRGDGSGRGSGSGSGATTWLDEAEELLTAAHADAKQLGNRLDSSEPVLGLARVYAAKGMKVEAEGMFLSVEARFRGLRERAAFTVLTAEVYCRALGEFARFLDRLSRDTEAAAKRKDADEVRAQFPEILGDGPPPVPLWFVDACIEQYAVPPLAIL